MAGRHRSATGVHIAGRVVRVVELERRRHGLVLRGMAEDELEQSVDPFTLGHGEGVTEVVEALRALADQAELEMRRVCVALDRRAYLLKQRPRLQAGARGRRALRAERRHLMWEAGTFLGDQLPGFCVDCAVARGCGFIVAARRQVLDGYAALFARLGVPDLDFDLEPFALHNAAEAAGVLAGGGTRVLLSLEDESTCLLRVEEGGVAEVRLTSGDGESGASQVERAMRCLAAAAPVENAAGIWVAARQAEAVSAELAKRLDVSCAPLSVLLAVASDTETGPSPDEATFAVAAGLALRRLGG
ncbi:MAG: hypothetical protein AB1505_32900 [Candidatus Latescibacterota bacterium]